MLYSRVKRYIAVLLAMAIIVSACLNGSSIYAFDGENTESSEEKTSEDMSSYEGENSEDGEESRSENSKDAESSEEEETEESTEESTEEDDDREEGESLSENEAALIGNLIEKTIEAGIFKDGDYTEISEEMEEYESEKNSKIRLSGMMPEDAYAKAYPVEIEIADKNVIAAYDISIFYEDEDGVEKEFQPDEDSETGAIKVEITNDAIKEAINLSGELSVYHAENEESPEEEIEKIDEGKIEIDDSKDTVSFEAESFSIYAVVDNNPAVRTYEFYTVSDNGVDYVPYYFTLETGESVYSQTIKNGDVLVVPQLPAYKSKTFSGWFVYDGENYSDEPFDFDNITEITENETVILRAKFENYAYVIFHEQYNGASKSWPVVRTKRVELGDDNAAQVRISDVTVIYDNTEEESTITKLFKGWSAGLISPSVVDDSGLITEDEITVSGNTDLYPVFRGVNWLSFWTGETGSGAEYVASKYFYDGDYAESSDLKVPALTGYSFEGWYTASGNAGVKVTDAQLNIQNGVSTGNIRTEDNKIYLNAAATLYAHWSAAATTFTVVRWRQSINDTITTDSSGNYRCENPTYDFADSTVETANSGSTVTLSSLAGRGYTASGNSGDYTGFYYAAADESITVAADGSSVLNIYYNRYTAIYIFNVKNDSGYSESYRFVGLYGQELSYVGETWPSGKIIYDGQNNGRTRIIFLDAFNYFSNVQPDNKHRLTMNFYIEGTDSNGTKTYNFIKQNIDGTYIGGQTYSVKISNTGSFILSEKFTGFTLCGYSFGAVVDSGFTSATAEETIDSNKLSGKEVINIYYARNSYELSFRDSDDNSEIRTTSVKYEDSISANKPEDPTPKSAGKVFAGWYADSACSKEFDFNQTMPLNNLVIYAKWSTEYYLINIDPNYGELADETATWFWEPYYGDKVEEYTNTTRNYIEALNGEYYYHIIRHSDLGIGDDYSEELEKASSRDAYYTTDIDKATDLTKSYAEANGAYKYAGWYEVKSDGTEELYNFDSEITHNLTLKLHWKEVGTYGLRYDAGEGTIDSEDGNEETYKILDESDYADNSEVTVNRVANPPAGYNFIGWTIKNDSSGSIYKPGDSFTFMSKYTELQATGEKYLILEAVYSKIATVTLSYSADGGNIDEDSVDYGSYDNPVVCDNNGTVATVSGITNNGKITLASGAGFSYENYIFKGWNTKADYSGSHFEPGGSYRIDSIGDNLLYAEWETKVYFDVNKQGASWDVSGEDLTASGNNVYYKSALLYSTVSEPDAVPISPDSDEMFAYWCTIRYSDNEDNATAYDFSSTVTGEMRLYGYWTGPIEVPIHAVDASEEVIVEKELWLSVNALKVNTNSEYIFSEIMENSDYVNPDNGYTAVFACPASGIDDISDDKEISGMSYNTHNKCVQITYADGSSEDLDSGDEIYFVYIKTEKELTVSFRLMNTDFSLSSAGVSDRTATVTTDAYKMENEISNPLASGYIGSNSNYKYFVYSIGEKNATKAYQIHQMSSMSDSSGNSSKLQIRNSWRGFEYSLDGEEWISCGYDIQLYVIYFEQIPSIVNIKEQTTGTREDAEKKFTYDVTISKTVTQYSQTYIYRKNYNGEWSLISTGSKKRISTSTSDVENYGFELSDGLTESAMVFFATSDPTITSTFSQHEPKKTDTWTFTETAQTISITQHSEEDYTTDNSGIERKSNYISEYTATETGTTQTVTYTNTHTPQRVQLHVAKTVNGQTVSADDLRSDDSSKYTAEIAIGNSISLTETNYDIFAGGNDRYEFAGVIYGSSDGEVINVKGTDITSLSYKKLSDSDYYGLYMNGTEEILLEDNDIYFVYYEKARVYYMKKDASGKLTEIEEIKRKGESVSLNGVSSLSQGYILESGSDALTISNGSGSGNWHFPPNLDGTTELSLEYLTIGVGNSDVVSIDELDTDKDSVTLKAEGGYLKYKLGSSARWENFSGSPAIYIVYNEPASYLKITNNTDKDYSYRITIYSGNYTKPILLKTENGYERLEVSENSTHYELNIKKGSSDTICVLNAVDMHYNVQVLDEEGNTVSTNGYRQLGFELEEDSNEEFGQLINGPEFEGSDSFTSAEESREFINIKYCDIRIPAPTNYKGNKEPFIMAMIISLLMIATALLIRNKRNEERENEKPRLAGKENNL